MVQEYSEIIQQLHSLWLLKKLKPCIGSTWFPNRINNYLVFL